MISTGKKESIKNRPQTNSHASVQALNALAFKLAGSAEAPLRGILKMSESLRLAHFPIAKIQFFHLDQK